MSNDLNINTKFTVDAKALKEMFKQLAKLQAKTKSMSKDMTRLSKDLKRLDSRFKNASGKAKGFTKSMSKQQAQAKKTAGTLKNLSNKVKQYNSGMSRATKTTKRGNTSLGFTGLAFGFIGGIAGFAASQIRTKFNEAIEESVGILSEINRISLFSDVGFLNGQVNIDGFNDKFTLTVDKAKEFGLLLTELPALLKDIEKSSPSSIAIDPFRDIILGFKVLENEVSTTKLAGDFSTILANFPEEDMNRIGDLMFAFSRESKLTFGAGSKAVAFAAQSAKLLNTELDELLGVMVNIVAAVPGERGNAGRSIRAFIGNLTELDSVLKLEAAGIPVIDDTTKKFIGLEQILVGFADKVKQIRSEQGDLAQIAFLEEFGLDKNALTGILSFVNATEEAKESARTVFAGVEGTLGKAIADQIKKPEAQFNRLKNIMTLVKLEFTQGLTPALEKLNDVLGEMFSDSSFSETIRQFGAAIGENLVGIAQVAVPVLKSLGAVFKDNAPLIKLVATSLVSLTGVLTGMAVIFPILGMFFALIFLHEKLITRALLLGTRATFVTKAYVAMSATLSALIVRFKVWLVLLTKGNFSLGIFNKLSKKMVATHIARMITGIKTLGVSFKIFALSASSSLITVGRAWLIALGPLAIAIGAFILLEAVIKRFETPITNLIDGIDKTGTASGNLMDNINGLFQILSGDFSGVFDRLAQDALFFQQGIEHIQSAWGILLEDLGKSAIVQKLISLWDKFNIGIDKIILSFDNFIIQLLTDIPVHWENFLKLLEGFDIWFRSLSGSANQFLIDIGFDMPAVWAQLDAMWQGLATLLEPITTPLQAFIDALDFELPDVWGEILKVMDAIASNPIVAAGLEILGIFDQFGKNLGNEDQKSFFPTPFDGSEGFIGPLSPPGLGTLPSTPLDPEELEKQLEILEENNEQLELSNKLIVQGNEILTHANPLKKQANVLNTSGNILASSSNTLLDANNIVVKEESRLLTISNDFERTSIEELADNINKTSSLTTTLALVQVMFAKLIAQGNRAAGKLSSLKVSSKGKFSITDPGISSVDRSFINESEAALASARSNQQVIDIKIEVTPTLTVRDGEISKESITAASDDIALETANALQKIIPSIITG